ncbi:MAG: GMC family oxidoreductase N-terminal domain-containing protein [Polyangiaceae bacterium]
MSLDDDRPHVLPRDSRGSHVSFRPRGETVEIETDYVVVGSGAGGATAAVTLARGGAKVAIVEAGPWREPSDYASSVYGALRDMVDAWGSNVTRGRAFWPIVQASLVGGTTVINSAIGVRTPSDIFEQWEREHGVGGAQLAEAVWRAQDGLERELCWEEVPAPSIGNSNRLALEAATKVGFESHYTKRYVKGCLGNGACLQGCRADKKQSLNRTFVPETLERGGDVLSCAPVARILFEGRRAVGVTGRFRHPQTRARGADFLVRARKGVVVAASVTQSPLLLLRSKVQNPLLGKLFRSHPGSAIFGCYDDPIDMTTGATQGWASVAYRERPGFKLETLSLPLDMVAGRLAGSGQVLMERLSEFRHLAMWVHACRAETVGEVSSSFTGRPVVRYTLGRDDMLRFREASYLLAKMHVAAGARAIVPCIFGMPYRLAPNEIDKLKEAPLDPRAYVAILSHLFGGCVMGKDPARSVCDGRGRVHGYEGLTIADASAIPTNLGVNPQHTIMALARVWAEGLLSA